MNTIPSLLALVGFACFGIMPMAKANSKDRPPNYSRQLIEQHWQKQGAIFEIQWNKNVKKFVGSYLERGRKSTAGILGRSSIYFPIIEQYLDQYDLPAELKYLAVIESALRPKARSESGAVGLWQLMSGTARQYGLLIDDYVDERLDLHRSTDAALRYLAQLHRQYEDWALAIAAYNCGPGRVDKAIKKAQSNDFWKLQKHLPKQTQRYIEKFIAAAFALDNYLFYDIHPQYPDYTLQLTTRTQVFTRQSFDQIAQQTGISVVVIHQLNPTYKKAIIPPNKKGYYLVLPRIGLSENWENTLAKS